MSATSKQRIAQAVRVVALLLSIACAPTPSVAVSDGRSSTASLRAEIEGINRQLEAAFNRKDMLTVARYYTDDAKLVGPRG